MDNKIEKNSEIEQAEYKKLLTEVSRELPSLDRRQKSIVDAVCLATARANRHAFQNARRAIIARRRRNGENNSCA